MVEIVPGVLWEIRKRSCSTKFTIYGAQILNQKNLHSNLKGLGGKTMRKNPYVFFKMVSNHFHPYYSFFKVVLGPLPLTCCSQLWANIMKQVKMNIHYSWMPKSWPNEYPNIFGYQWIDQTNIQIYVDGHEMTEWISK